MLNPLIIAGKENAGILRKACTEAGASAREIIGEDWSLALFLKSDLKNYLFHSHYILDVSAFTEKDDEFIALVEGITYQKDGANIIIYADRYYSGDDFLDKLVKRGFTNIVANYSDADEKTNIGRMSEDLKECLSGGLPKQKWRRYDKSYDSFAEIKEAAAIAENVREKPTFSNVKLHIAVVGAQSRIGSTTFAVRIAEYFNSRGAQSVVICSNKNGIPQMEMMSEFYGGNESGGFYTINGIDLCSADAEAEKSYNIEIYDFGNTPASRLTFDGFDKIYLIGGTSWNELPMIYSVQTSMNGVNYTVIANFSDYSAIEKYRELLSQNLNNVILSPYEPDAFSFNKFETIFDNEFEQWRDNEETP